MSNKCPACQLPNNVHQTRACKIPMCPNKAGGQHVEEQVAAPVVEEVGVNTQIEQKRVLQKSEEGGQPDGEDQALDEQFALKTGDEQAGESFGTQTLQEGESQESSGEGESQCEGTGDDELDDTGINSSGEEQADKPSETPAPAQQPGMPNFKKKK